MNRNFCALLLLAFAALFLAGCLAKPAAAPTATPTHAPVVEITATPMPRATPVPTPRITPTPAPVAISACTEITRGGEYFLDAGIRLSRDHSTCISISAENVRLDCRGNAISSRGKNNTGIILIGANKSGVENCNASGFYQNLVLRNTHRSKILSNNLSGNYFAITLNDSSRNEITGNNASGFLSGSGIRLLSRSGQNTVSGNEFSKNEQGAFVSESDSNAFLNNVVRDNIFAGIWFFNSENNTVRGNDLSTSKKLESHHAGAITQNGDNSFANNTICTAAAYDVQCINGHAQDMGGNKCVKKANGCGLACSACPA
ncbi:MAG: NosD domain-containing protein [Candidatus Micrarchaeia archaeon]|jgi:parallel beta-helix repeat protein